MELHPSRCKVLNRAIKYVLEIHLETESCMEKNIDCLQTTQTPPAMKYSRKLSDVTTVDAFC